MAKVFIGVDPHKLSATIEVVDDLEAVYTTGRFGTAKAGYAAMRKHVEAWPDRFWAVEESNGPQRLGEHTGSSANATRLGCHRSTRGT